MSRSATAAGARRRPRFADDRRRLLIGVGLVVLVYVATASYAALTLPLPGTRDSTFHLDYVYQVALGQLPAAEGYELYPGRGGRQFASAHPPLYYALMALLAGGFLPDQQGTAIAIIRAANIGLGALTLVAIAWFGAQIGGRHRVPVAIGMAAIAGSAFPMIRFGAEIYNDMLVALAAALALALATRIILTGRTTWVTGIGLALVSVVGLGTKATFVIPLAVVVGGLVLAALVRRVAGERRAPLRMVLVALGALAAAVAANAWFYLINLERSGSLHRSSPKAPVGGRAHRSTADVLGDLDFWTVVGRGFIGRAEPDHERFTAMSALVVGAMLVAGLAALVAVVLRRRRLPAMTGVVGLMLVLLVVGAYVSQLSHATGYGAYNFRYFMPAMVAIAFLLAAGLAIVPRVGLPIVIAAAAFFGAMNAFSATLYAMSMQRIPEFGPGIPLLIADRNGIAPAAIVACVVVAVGAVLALLVLSFGPLAARRSAHPESNLERTGA